MRKKRRKLSMGRRPILARRSGETLNFSSIWRNIAQRSRAFNQLVKPTGEIGLGFSVLG